MDNDTVPIDLITFTDYDRLTYKPILPLVSCFGIIGNLISILILSRKPFAKNILYAYLMSLSIVDLFYLGLTLVMVIIAIDNYSTINKVEFCEEQTENSMNMFRNVLPVVIDTFGTTADLIIACMTFNRFIMLRSAASLKVERQKKWVGYFESFSAFVMSLMAHVPNFFKYTVSHVNVTFSTEDFNFLNNTFDCWVSNLDEVTDTIEWDAYNLVFHAIIRILPTIFITGLNISMVYKIKQIFSTRNRLFGTKAPQMKKVSQVTIHGNHLTLPTISEKTEKDEDRRRSSSNSSEILRKIVRKWKYRDVRKAKRKFRNSTTLVWIVVTHTVLTTPGNVMFILYSTSSASFPLTNNGKDGAVIRFANTMYVFYVISHAINHILYCLTNRHIQEETAKIIFNCRNIYWSKSTK